MKMLFGPVATSLFLIVSCGKRDPAGDGVINMPLHVKTDWVIFTNGMSRTEALNALPRKPADIKKYPDKKMEVWWILEDERNIDPKTDIGGITVFFKDDKVLKTSPIYVTVQGVKH